MSVQIVNYTEVCSNALLAIVDNDSTNIKYHDDGRYEIIIDNQFKSLIKFYVKSFCKNYRQFGVKTVVIKTCRPMNNWRQEERGSAIKACRYFVTDIDSFLIDKYKLEGLLENCWSSLQKELKEFSFIECNSVDFIDITQVLKEFIMDSVIIHPTHFYFLRDVNTEYMHMYNIPKRIKTQVEILLREKRLIL